MESYRLSCAPGWWRKRWWTALGHRLGRSWTSYETQWYWSGCSGWRATPLAVAKLHCPQRWTRPFGSSCWETLELQTTGCICKDDIYSLEVRIWFTGFHLCQLYLKSIIKVNMQFRRSQKMQHFVCFLKMIFFNFAERPCKGTSSMLLLWQMFRLHDRTAICISLVVKWIPINRILTISWTQKWFYRTFFGFFVVTLILVESMPSDFQ